MNNQQLVRDWLATSPGTFEATSVQRCVIAAHEASGLPIQINYFRGELEALGLSIRCVRSSSTDRPGVFRLTLSKVEP